MQTKICYRKSELCYTDSIETSATKIILASASPARAKVLSDAGLNFTQIPADIDEDALLARLLQDNHDFENAVELLARAKADSVSRKVAEVIIQSLEKHVNSSADVSSFIQSDSIYVIIGCDSMFEFEGNIQGKPAGKNEALANIMRYSGKSGVLHTGHTVIVLKSDGQKTEASCALSTKIQFAKYDADVAQKYVNTLEPRDVAGSFRIDGRGSALIKRIEGDYHSVVGISPNCIRELMNLLDIEYSNLW